MRMTFTPRSASFSVSKSTAVLRGRAHQHPPLAPDGFDDGLHQRGGFARAGRAVNNGHILGRHHVPHRRQL